MIASGAAAGAVLTNTATVMSDNPDTQPDNDTATDDTTVTREVDIVITKSDNIDPVVAGLALYPRDAMFMVKLENAEHRYLRYFFGAYGAVPVERGQADPRG